MKPRARVLHSLTCVVLLAAGAAVAEPLETPVTIRVQAHDAKFIGTGVGEMNVTVEDAETGALLATGRIAGGTGDTDRLVKNPIVRGAPLADDKTAAYVARLKLERPTRVRIRASGPLESSDATQELAVTTWVVPGRPIGGDGDLEKIGGRCDRLRTEVRGIDDRTGLAHTDSFVVSLATHDGRAQ